MSQEPEIKITIRDLEIMLDEQKKKVIDRLLNQTYSFNLESTESTFKPLLIDKEKFTEIGMKSAYPDDFNILKKHIK